MPVAAALQHASCYSPATCQLQLVLNTCSRCMDCKKAVVWYNSVLGPLPSLLALICSCRCAFCKDVINLTAHKNSTRHFNINAGMPLHTTYPHDLNSEFFVSVHYHTACSYPDCKQEDIINCEAAIRDHKRYMKWHQLKQAVIILSDDDDVVDSPSTKVPPHPPMFSKLCNLPVAGTANGSDSDCRQRCARASGRHGRRNHPTPSTTRRQGKGLADCAKRRRQI